MDRIDRMVRRAGANPAHPANPFHPSSDASPPAYPMRERGAGQFQRLVAVADVDLAVEVVDVLRIGGQVHAAEGPALHDREADGDAFERERLEPVLQQGAQLQLEAVRGALIPSKE